MEIRKLEILSLRAQVGQKPPQYDGEDPLTTKFLRDNHPKRRYKKLDNKYELVNRSRIRIQDHPCEQVYKSQKTRNRLN